MTVCGPRGVAGVRAARGIVQGTHTRRVQGLGRGARPIECRPTSAFVYGGITSRDVVINDVTLTSLKTPEWSQLVFCDDFVTILFLSLWWRHICSSVTKLVFPS
jgi:hypothetical protein